MSGFVVNLDLTNFFSDLRQFSKIYVDQQKYMNVGDVLDHVKHIFKLRDGVCLVNGQFLLPVSEDIMIFQGCETVKVQKCDFFDQQIHKTKEAVSVKSQAALNLVQLEKTVDLSCKPKQRFKVGPTSLTCTIKEDGSNSSAAPSSTHFCQSYQNNRTGSQCLDKQNEKGRKRKEGNDLCSSSEPATYNYKSENAILDMSFNKAIDLNVNKCFCAPTEEDTDTVQNISYNQHVKKRKLFNYSAELQEYCYENKPISNFEKAGNLQHQISNVDFGNTFQCGIASDDNIKSSKKAKKKKKEKALDKHLVTIENIDNVTDSSEKLNTFCVKSQKKLPKRVRNSADEKDNFIIKEDTFVSKEDQNKQETELSLVQNDSEGKLCSLEDRKRECQKLVDVLIKNKTDNKHTFSRNENSFNGKEINYVENSEDGSDYGSQLNNTQTSFSEEQSVHSEFLTENIKRKRIRRHNKKKKRERQRCVREEAVGPILKNLSFQELRPLSEAAKHIFFSDNDCSEEVNAQVSTLERTVKEPTKHIGPFTNSCGGSSLEEEKNSCEPTTWQKEFLRIAKSPKPIVFSRSCSTVSVDIEGVHTQSEKYSQQTPPCLTSIDLPLGNATKMKCDELKLEDNSFEVSKKCNVDLRTESDSEVNKINSTKCEVNIEKNKSGSIMCDELKHTLMSTSNGIQNITLTNYPIVEKVALGDLIVFKVLKLTEKFEPGVSKAILAKVNSTVNFPEKLSLLIIEGHEEFESFEGSDTTTMNLGWTDLIEPRLVYP